MTLTKEEAIARANRVHGYMNHKELGFLWDVHVDPAIKISVEVGSFLGRSACLIASALDGHGFLVSIDHHDHIFNRDGMKNESSWQPMLKNILDKRNVLALRATSGNIVRIIGTDPDIVFIDGNHEYEAVGFDIKMWAPKTRRLLIHDYRHNGGQGIIKAVDGLIKENSEWKIKEIVSSLAYLTKSRS